MAFDFISLSPITAYTCRESGQGLVRQRTVCALDGGCGKTSLLRGGDECPEGTFVVASPIERLSGLWTDESEISAVELGDVVADRLSDTASCLQTNGGTC